MGKELTFDNLHSHLYDFTKIENGIIDVSSYDFVEPVGIAILEAVPKIHIVILSVSEESHFSLF
jgi:hypothetical protein